MSIASTDTILSRYASEISEQMNSAFQLLIKESPIFSFSIHLGLGFFFLALARSIQKREATKYLYNFTLFVFLCLPVGNGIMYGKLAKTIEQVVDSVLGSLDKKIFDKFSAVGRLPPGYIYKAIDRAVNARIDNQMVKDLIRESLTTCVPMGKRYDGKDITARDIFEVQTLGNGNSSDGIVFKNFDGNILKTRSFTSIHGNGSTTNCFDHVGTSIFALRKVLRRQLQFEDTSDFSANEKISNIVKQMNQESINDPSARDAVDSAALNIAQANAIKSYVYKKTHPDADTSSFGSSVGVEYSDQLRGSTAGGVMLTVANTWPAIMRAFGVQGYGDAVSKLTELNERTNNLPYTIVSIKNILNFCLPIALLALVMNLPVGLYVWLGAWLGICIVPHAMFFLRIHSNIVLNSVLKLTEAPSLEAYSSNALVQQVALTSVKQALQDSSIAISQMVNTEFFVLGGFMTILPGLGFIANSKSSSGLLSKIGTFATQAAIGTGTRAAIGSAINSTSSLGNESVSNTTSMTAGNSNNGIGSTIASDSQNIGFTNSDARANNNGGNLYAFNNDIDPDPVIGQ